ncbi:MAG TPA: hypoxanthine phosphoribosyltransferase [Candidatus Hydrogenedentes bacterium]|nr:hypoxanthine phosphoribosyltransferase [Candidatus Hydrogenedentota bacterium]HQH67089.1 hypoxanthine phosphoribosyltransferase [Candidatus Hydrogenedentota bacterium]HQM50763.1 hypoxanthine phosphoribosyltransferase [Candidatus Hydrogenedentota bacterium]
MRHSSEPLISESVLQNRIKELAAEISRDYANRNLVLAVVLKGALMFAADLSRKLTIPASIEFVRARSYQGTRSSRRVRVTVFPEESLAGKHVLIIEDILDTGYTTHFLLDRFRDAKPDSLELCTLLDKPARRNIAVDAKYVGFTIDDRFVVGYGLDYEEKFRELPAVYVLEET